MKRRKRETREGRERERGEGRERGIREGREGGREGERGRERGGEGEVRIKDVSLNPHCQVPEHFFNGSMSPPGRLELRDSGQRGGAEPGPGTPVHTEGPHLLPGGAPWTTHIDLLCFH